MTILLQVLQAISTIIQSPSMETKKMSVTPSDAATWGDPVRHGQFLFVLTSTTLLSVLNFSNPPPFFYHFWSMSMNLEVGLNAKYVFICLCIHSSDYPSVAICLSNVSNQY